MAHSLNLFLSTTSSQSPDHYPHSKPTPFQTPTRLHLFPFLTKPLLKKPLFIASANNGPALSVLTPDYVETTTTTTKPGSVLSSIDVDSVTEAELKENGFRSTRRTKLVCTIGPATCGFEQLEGLAVGGMNVRAAEWHKGVIDKVRT